MNGSKKPIMDNKKELFLILTIVIAGIISYSNSFDCSFHFDDTHFLDISVTNDVANVVDWIRLAPSRPLGILTFAVNYNLHQLDVWGYHLVNLFIHLINALLVYWLTWITLSSPVMKDDPISRNKTIIAFMTGLLFVTHPLATQSVTYIVQRFASLATLFYLLSLILFIRGRLWQGDRNTSLLFFSASIFSGICGMLTKEIVFTLPFAILLYDYFFLKASPWKLELKDKGLMVSFIMLTIFLLLIFRVRSVYVFHTVEPGQGYAYSISMQEYLFTQFRVILTYIRLLILPFHQNFDYDYPVSTTLFHIKTFLSFLALLGIALTGFLLFKKYRLIAFGIFWFILTLLVESSIIPISQNVIYEHRTYLSSFGFFIALTGGFFYLFQEKHLRIGVFILLVIASLNATLAYQRNKIWQDEYTLWADCLKKSPNKARVNNNFGNALFNKGDYEKALYYYNKAIFTNNHYADYYNNRGTAMSALGYTQKALEDYNEAIRLKPDYVDAYNNRGILYDKLGQYPQAIQDYNETIRRNHHYANAYNNRGTIYGRQGQYQKAINDFNKAITIKSNHALAHHNLGYVYSLLGQYQPAIKHYNNAITYDPKYSVAYQSRAIAYLKLGNTKQGCFDAQRACMLGNCTTLKSAQAIGLCR